MDKRNNLKSHYGMYLVVQEDPGHWVHDQRAEDMIHCRSYGNGRAIAINNRAMALPRVSPRPTTKKFQAYGPVIFRHTEHRVIIFGSMGGILLGKG